MLLNNSEDLKSQHIRVNDGQFTFELNEDKTASIVDYDSLSGDHIIIPRSIKYNEQEFIVTSIKKDSFKHIRGITSIQFPLDSKVQIIEEKSFDDCFVKKILLPPSIAKLCDGWISSGCGLNEVKMISNNQYYKNYNDEFIIGKSDPTSDEYDVLVFANRFIEEITVPSFIKQISPNCFSFSKLTKIFITSQVTQIGREAFSNCFKLTTIQFEPGSQLQRIEDDLFFGTRLKSVTFPPKVKQIGRYAFANCDHIKSVKFTSDSELELIESEVFWNSGISSILIPSNTKLAEGWCYLTHCLDEVALIPRNNPNLKQYDDGLILGKSDTKSDIFDVVHFCPRISQTITIPPFIRRIDSGSFAFCYIENIVIPPKVTQIGKFAFHECQYLHSLECTEDSELDIIEDDAFAESSIASITIPSCVSHISESWVYEANHLQSVNLIESKQKQQQNIKYHNNQLLLGKSDIKSDTFDILIYTSEKAKFVDVPSSVKIINSFAFDKSSVVKVVVHEKVEKIGKNAFTNCSKLYQVDYPKKSKIRKIKDQTFMKSAIHHFHLPSYITKIGQNAFLDCNNLCYLDVPSNSELKVIKRDIITTTACKSFWIPPHVTHLDDFAFQNDSLQIIQFDDNSELEEIVINQNCFRDKIRIMIPSNLIDRIIFMQKIDY